MGRHTAARTVERDDCQAVVGGRQVEVGIEPCDFGISQTEPIVSSLNSTIKEVILTCCGPSRK